MDCGWGGAARACPERQQDGAKMAARSVLRPSAAALRARGHKGAWASRIEAINEQSWPFPLFCRRGGICQSSRAWQACLFPQEPLSCSVLVRAGLAVERWQCRDVHCGFGRAGVSQSSAGARGESRLHRAAHSWRGSSGWRCDRHRSRAEAREEKARSLVGEAVLQRSSVF